MTQDRQNGFKTLDSLWAEVDRGRATEAQRERAAAVAGKLGRVEDRPRLIRLLGDPAADVRYRALRVLVLDLDDVSEEIEGFAWRLLDDHDELVRMRAAISLGKILWVRPSATSFDRLAEHLGRSGEDPDVRSALHDSLFRIARRPPTDWPSSGPRRAFTEEEINWDRIAELREEVARLEKKKN